MAAPAGSQSVVGLERRPLNIVDILGRFAPLFVLLVLVAILSYLEPGFRTERNIFNVLRQISIIGILAVGMTFESTSRR